MQREKRGWEKRERNPVQNAQCSSSLCVCSFYVDVAVAVAVCFIHLNFNRKLENRIYIFIFK